MQREDSCAKCGWICGSFTGSVVHGYSAYGHPESFAEDQPKDVSRSMMLESARKQKRSGAQLHAAKLSAPRQSINMVLYSQKQWT
jgi:hypothetical protein